MPKALVPLEPAPVILPGYTEQGMYITRPVFDLEILKRFVAQCGVPHQQLQLKEAHASVVHSEVALPVATVAATLDRTFVKVQPLRWSWFGDYLVVELVPNPQLTACYDNWLKLGAVSDFPDYKPHISVGTGIMKRDLFPFNQRLKLRQFEFVLREERVADIKKD